MVGKHGERWSGLVNIICFIDLTVKGRCLSFMLLSVAPLKIQSQIKKRFPEKLKCFHLSISYFCLFPHLLCVSFLFCFVVFFLLSVHKLHRCNHIYKKLMWFVPGRTVRILAKYIGKRKSEESSVWRVHIAAEWLNYHTGGFYELMVICHLFILQQFVHFWKEKAQTKAVNSHICMTVFLETKATVDNVQLRFKVFSIGWYNANHNRVKSAVCFCLFTSDFCQEWLLYFPLSIC